MKRAGASPSSGQDQEFAMRIAHAVIISLALVSGALAQSDRPATVPPSSQPPAQDAELVAGNEAFQKEDWAAAVKSYQAAIEKGSKARIIHFRLGYSLHMLKRYDEALKHHLLAVQLTNRALRIDALYNCACAHALLGRKDDALKFLQYAIDAGFKDTAQAAKDTDLDSLRSDEAFKTLVEGIGKTPRLDQQMDFLLGTWTSKNEKGDVTQTLTVSRPLADSQALVTTTTNIGGGAWTGILTPNAGERTWLWTSVDGSGTTLALTGKSTGDGGVRFEGRESSIGGLGARVRLTFTPSGRSVIERAEVSEDGVTWRLHHEEKYVKKSAAQPSTDPR
jgi:tetratricopeptide (TPR) repeat protein